MLLAVERRFDALRTAEPIEWLADNGSCFTAHETVAFAHAIGLVPCFTPVRSPESNGIAEAFVKTFKRDYVRLSARPDATAVLAALDSWFEDYNECTRIAPSGCARPASSSGRTNPSPV
jgi:putative transposase